MRKHLVFSLLFLAGFHAAFSQGFDSLLTIQRAADPQEKAYVQFDKPYYNPGETIWFKAYLFTGIELSDASKTFYAELLDENGNLISQKTAPIGFSGASGSFDLDSAFNKRLIYFRGYTLSMLNGDTAFFYTKAIRVLSTKAAAVKNTIGANTTTLRFLPEGGDWVAGLPATVAFIATNVQGLPALASGVINDGKGAKLIDFKTLHDGMGSIFFTPEAGETYTAVWKDEAGKSYATALPAAKNGGAILQVTDEADGNKRFTLRRSADAPDNLKQLYLVGIMNQHEVFEARINLSAKTLATGVLPVKAAPSGILQITLFDAANKPVAERITFVNNHDYEFDGDAFLAQKSTAKRGQNTLEISTSDTMPANLSVAITDADLNAVNNMDDNIISRMLLTGELRGKISAPYYYFFNTGDSAAIYLDLVMLTHGWRRYNWENLWAGKTLQAKWKENNFLSMIGQVTGMPPGSYAPGLQLTGILQTADSAKSIVVLPVDKAGKVFSEGMLFYDKAKLFFSFSKKNLSFDKSMLMLDNGLRKGYSKALPDTTAKAGLPDLSPAVITANNKNTKMSLQASRLFANSKVLATVTVTARAKTVKDKMEEKYVSGLFGGSGANSFDLVNDPLAGSYMDIFQFLQGRVAGLQISTGGGTPSLSWRGGTPALYLNEMQTDVSLLQSTPVSDIAYVKIFRPGESIVSGGGGGVIAIYTRKGGDAPPDPNAKGLSYVAINGYSPIKQFYSPDYATFSEKDAYDDVRSTLYWNPAVYLDKSRKRVRIKFYNNDITKHFRLVMEGINTDGKMIHVEKEIEGAN